MVVTGDFNHGHAPPIIHQYIYCPTSVFPGISQLVIVHIFSLSGLFVTSCLLGLENEGLSSGFIDGMFLLGPEHRMVRGPIEIVRILIIIQAKEGAF